MKPARFTYLRPETTDEALGALATHGSDARILAGGQSLMAVLNMRLAQPGALVDISMLAELAYLRDDGDVLAIGAATTQGALERHPGLRDEVPLAALALPWVSHFQIKNKGTVCGSIAHADPSAELPLVLCALQGEVVLASAAGRRTVAAEEFFQGMLQTACAPDEMIVEVRLPRRRARTGYAFREVAQRHGDFALVALAAVCTDEHLSLAVGGVADRPVVRHWPVLDGTALDDALNEFAWALGAEDDAHASAAYRRHLTRVLGRQVLEEARP